MAEEMILPGQNSFDTSELTNSDFKDAMLSNKIKSTFIKDNGIFEFPMLCIDISNAGPVLHTSLKALQKLLIPDEDLVSTEDENLVYLYVRGSGGKTTQIGGLREYTARHIIPSFIKSTFPDNTVLYISEDGKSIDEFKKASMAGVKLHFDY